MLNWYMDFHGLPGFVAGSIVHAIAHLVQRDGSKGVEPSISRLGGNQTAIQMQMPRRLIGLMECRNSPHSKLSTSLQPGIKSSCQDEKPETKLGKLSGLLG